MEGNNESSALGLNRGIKSKLGTIAGRFEGFRRDDLLIVN